MRAKLPQVQPGSAVESSLEQGAFLQTDTHKTCSVRGLLCRLPALNQAQESSLPSVFAAILHQRSPLQTRQNNLSFSFSVALTLTHIHTALLVCLK